MCGDYNVESLRWGRGLSARVSREALEEGCASQPASSHMLNLIALCTPEDLQRGIWVSATRAVTGHSGWSAGSQERAFPLSHFWFIHFKGSREEMRGLLTSGRLFPGALSTPCLLFFSQYLFRNA